MDIFVFISMIISLLTTTVTVNLLCKHKKIRALIASLVLHQVKEVGAISESSGETNSECTTLAYIGIIHFCNRNTRNHVNLKLICADILQNFLFFFRWHVSCNPNAIFCMGSLDVAYQ